MDPNQQMAAALGNVDPVTGVPLQYPPADQAKFGRIADALVGGLKDTVEFPGNYMAHGIDRGAATEWAAPMSMGMMGVGAPNAMTGAAGIFGGKLAQSADLAALSKAKDMAGNLAGKDKIIKETGWFQGADGKWRFEIPDNDLRIFPDGTHNPNTQIHHQKLSEAYPQLFDAATGPDVAIDVMPGPKSGSFMKVSDMPPFINVRAPDEFGAKKTLLHELQHAVQDIEGFQRGSNPNKELRLLQQSDIAKAKDHYWRNAGEVEARNVSYRSHFWDGDWRRILPPWKTEDIPAHRQIVKALRD